MRVLVTGATGFLGREVVAKAVQADHQVTALIGPHRNPEPDMFDSRVSLLRGDLRHRAEWTEAFGTIDVVIHAAAAAGGDRAQQLSSTVVGTENLLEALRGVRLERFVHISSFSVYDFHSLARGAVLDETTAIEPQPSKRDAYTEAKITQELLVRRWCEEQGVPCVILRPGAIVGPGKAWGHGAEFTLGAFSFVVAPRATFRLVSLSNCADAVVDAVDLDANGTVILNVVDDQLPTNGEFFRLCRRAGAPTGTMVPIPWFLVESVGRLLQLVSRRLLGGRLRLPELLDHRRQEARWKPLRYPNDRARHVLGWRSMQNSAATASTTVAPTEIVNRG